jgi:hypothetical protein
MFRWISLSAAFVLLVFIGLPGCNGGLKHDANDHDQGKHDGKTQRDDIVKYEPEKDASDKKKTVNRSELYRTPGGIYTAADIKANGDLPPKVKFKGVVHRDEETKPGDKICPISDNKANPQCFWIVNGQRYEFCCPPCVDSFLKLAHDEPAKVKDAAAYVKGP